MFDNNWIWSPGTTAHFVTSHSVDVDPRGSGVDDIYFSTACGERIEDSDPGFTNNYSFGFKEGAEADGASLCSKCLKALDSATK